MGTEKWSLASLCLHLNVIKVGDGLFNATFQHDSASSMTKVSSFHSEVIGLYKLVLDIYRPSYNPCVNACPAGCEKLPPVAGALDVTDRSHFIGRQGKTGKAPSKVLWLASIALRCL